MTSQKPTSGETERSYIPVENPADRPRTLRTTVRVLLTNPAGETLLFEDSDPGLDDARWWVTPGGGIDAGETETEAAVREVWEETGFQLDPADLLGPVAHRHVVHGYSDRVIEQDESFYLALVPDFTVDTSAHTPDEQLTFQQHRWWSTEELRATDDWVWPHELVELLHLVDERDRWPVALGTQEESTVLDVH
ncbi:NUDIX hydrolase [Microlunatus capsulatus]|uniref:8-oxo-dGTP pyrophosphatase MutT (NUDIX family) n=1 Tax=Microlunatus capsulatus TaxID=99117 RepID=A0ABS4ZB71_9ACTN|nr:NUDIX domain-containing protein [Microlunatus capsulatus]MBP2417957.1 8-oxo-dGTP pyrophosphatase MutT (NUDIX family) [Microlunatus capsulatus]